MFIFCFINLSNKMITCFRYACMFQGFFSHWMNGLPVTHTNWYKPDLQYGVFDLIVHNLHNEVYIKHIIVQNLKYKYQNIAEQPEMSHTKNCTALVLTRSAQGVSPMITIPCDFQFNTTYLCYDTKVQYLVPMKNLSLVNSRPCDGDWFTIKGATKCFSFSWTKRKISYNDARELCASKNSAVLTSEVGPVTVHDIHPRLRHHYAHDNITSLLKAHFVLGQRLSREAPHSRLPVMIHSLTEEAPDVFFTSLNNKCSLMERHETAKNYRIQTNDLVLKWLVKCQHCAEPMNVSAVICEKLSRPLLPHCDDHYFTCDDGTCILLIYKCDFISDCFDKSDEDVCNGASIWSNSSLTLPCHQGVLCDGEAQLIIPLHAICDGIYSNTTFVQEEYTCWQFHLQHINVRELSKDINKVHKRLRRLSPCNITNNLNYIRTLSRYHLNKYTECIEQKGIVDNFSNHSKRVMYDSIVCTRKHHTSLIENCKIGVNASDGAVATAYDDLDSCLWVTCPGMFKCYNNFCIYLSAVCDGHYDCRYGDDELLCPLLSCSGFLKCRGENRCVSSEEICDNNINCLYSMDDEVGCNKCPDHCHCEGYSLSCEVKNSLDIILASHKNHVKGFLMKGVQNIFDMRQMNLIGLVHLNVSFCYIETVQIRANDPIINGFIVITDFSNNKLVSIHFLNNNVYKNIVFLDLSFNLITMLKNVFLDKIVFLALKGNPLKELEIYAFQHNAKSLIDMRHIYFKKYMILKFPSAVSKQMNVKVSEPIICCIMSTDIKCTSSLQQINCFGIFTKKIEQIISYCITVLSAIAAIVLVVKHILSRWLVRKQISQKKNQFTIILVNWSWTAVVNSIYRLGILVADIAHVNIFVWIKSHACIFLNSFLYISLVSDMIFKTALLIFVSLQIIYPFKHNCLWLRWTAVFSASVWSLVCSTYFINLIEVFLFEETHHFDHLCSIAGCGVKDNFHLLLGIICLTDCFMISLSIYTLIQVYISLAKSAVTKGISTKKQSVVFNIKIILKVSYPIILEIPFRVSLVCLLAIQLSNTSPTQFCNYIFMYILSINFICAFFVSVYQH